MLLSYHECLENMVQIIKLKNIQEGHLFITEKGLYSEDRYVPELEIIMKKYPNAILTLNSAFYYYGLTDTIPDHYYVATPKSNRKIEDVRVKFSFDLYKEIISNYRKLIHKMDMTQIMEYAYELPKTNMVMETIRLEIL